MKTKIFAPTLALAAALALVAVVPTFAQSVTASVNAAVNTPSAQVKSYVRPTAASSRVIKEIPNRIDSLNKLAARIQSMKNLSDAQKASFKATIQSSVTDMANLASKIQLETSTSSLAADLKSIAPDYRIYMLVEPQVSIMAAADRVNTIVTTLQTLETKIQGRVASTTNADTLASLQSALTDITAKLADATKQAQAATTEVSGLVPDNGDKTVMTSNTAALKDARSKIQAANKDIQAAYKDAQSVVKGVKGTQSH